MTKTSKRIVSIISAIAIMMSIICVAGTATASADTDRVSLYSSGVDYEKFGTKIFHIYIKTNDNAQDQKVYIHAKPSYSSTWEDFEAKYVTTLSDGSKIWNVNCTGITGYSYNVSFEYAIKYVADGITYWDNNNGNNYDGSETLGTGPITVRRRTDITYNHDDFPIFAILQNYAYEKNVFVRYSTDNWNTYHDAALSYSETNDDGTELWTTNIDLSASSGIHYGYTGFEYAVCYQVNGQEYWANNFGDNYDINYRLY